MMETMNSRSSTVMIEIGQEVMDDYEMYNPFRSEKAACPNSGPEPVHYFANPSKGQWKDESGPTDSTREESCSEDEPDVSFSETPNIEPEKTLAEHIFSVVCQKAPWLGNAVNKAKVAVSTVMPIDACINGTYSEKTAHTSPRSTEIQSTNDHNHTQTKLSRLMQAKGLQTHNHASHGDDPKQHLWVLTGSCESLGCVRNNTEDSANDKVAMTQLMNSHLLLKNKATVTLGKTHSSPGQSTASKMGTMKQNKLKSPTSAIIHDTDEADNDTHALAVAEAMADALRAEQISTDDAANPHGSEFLDPLGTAIFNKISAISHGIVDLADMKIRAVPIDTELDAEASEYKPPPVDAIDLESQRVIDFQRSVSELTMKSSHAHAISQVSHIRRMAYYAVGKHVQNADADQRRGGNRRCYFTGKLILGGKPFYAGKLDQGLKTLVVFCLPTALGLPTMKELKMAGVSSVTLKHMESVMMVSKAKGGKPNNIPDQDAFDDVPTDLILQALPHPSQKLLNKMERKYPGPFSALPVIVRKPECWGLYSKFCFFSGLPIADGEMYFKVREDVAKLIPQRAYYGIEHIILSYEVLETANGAQSAEILKLPSSKTFKYLQKHYAQQCSKLHVAVFDRNSWETVMPEI